MLVDHDIHVHTFLSACSSDEAATPTNIIARAAAEGLRTIGFADHMWDSRMPGVSRWYEPQDYEHIAQIRKQMPDDRNDVRILIGCESEYCGDGKVGISKEVAEQLDFVLLPMSHLHMKGFVEPSGIDSPKDVAELMVQRYRQVIELGLATGIAHPFFPCGYAEQTDEIIGLIPDSVFEDCFARTAELGISIEVTTAFFPGLHDHEPDGFHDETFLRMLSIARGAGCVFHFASDTHRLAGIGACLQLEEYARAAGITKNDVLPLLREG